ncbi:hypothetical protein MC885_010216 [Smutsia gigantea]|nr:hypothetical protein MC885_010216 [Smutsia gigantea]
MEITSYSWLGNHSPPSQPKVNRICQSHHQEEIIEKLTMQLRNIGDSIDHRMAQEGELRQGHHTWSSQRPGNTGVSPDGSK